MKRNKFKFKFFISVLLLNILFLQNISFAYSYYVMPSEVGASLGFGAGGNGKKSGSFGVNSGSSNRDSAWVNDMTEITGANVDIAVAGKTSITGAMIDGDDNLHLTTNELEFKDLHDFERVGETGFGVSTSVGVSTDKGETSLHPNGETSLTLKDTGHNREQITRATIGAGEIIVGGVSNPELDGLNRDTTKAQEITKDITTGTLDATASIDNRVFTSEGRAEIAREHEGLGENLSQIGSGLRNNIITKTIENTRTGDKSLSENFYDYVEQDRQMTELKENRKDLMLALNGMTNFDSEEAKNILQQIADLTAGENGFSGKLQLANVEGNIAGFSYQSNDGEIKNITINLANVDLTKPNDLMNVIYHETTNFEEHSRKEQNAINRGETGAGIFGLKNFGNENTNGMSNTEWMKENNLTIGSTGSLSLLNDVNNSQIGNGEGNTSILGTVAVAGKVGLWVWSTYIAGKSAENVGSNIASWANGADENGLYMTEYGKVNKDELLYSTSKNTLGLISSSYGAGGSNFVSGLGYTIMGTLGLAEDGFVLSQGKNSDGYYENLSGQYMTDSDLATDAGFNLVSVGLGGYQVRKSKIDSITFDKIEKVYTEAKRTNYNNTLKGLKGAREYRNDGRYGSQLLPEGGDYVEFDLAPKIKGVKRNMERIVIDKSSGKVYYTNNHYETFTDITEKLTKGK